MVPQSARASSGRPEPMPWLGPSAGLRILIPGYPQWVWKQRERALVLFCSFAASLAVGTFTWGTYASLLILAFAFGTHVISAADVIRQSAFPGFGRWVPVASASAGLGLGCYGPMLALAMVYAWPSFGGEKPTDGYLVNRAAYWSEPPSTGQWAWARVPGYQEPRPVRVLAGPGQVVEWSASGLRVAGLGVGWEPPAPSWRPRELAFTVPDGQILVAPEFAGPLKDGTSCGLVLVDAEQIGGRAWARFYPIWIRGFIR